MSQAVCLYRNGYGQFCEKPTGHTGNHRSRCFSITDAQRAYLRQSHVGDPRWRWTGNGWITHDPGLVAEGIERLAASKKVVS